MLSCAINSVYKFLKGDMILSEHLAELTAALQDLPELYQPVFGHETQNISPKRICLNRLTEFKKVYDSLSKELKRPLRVLDLGCNMGFFSLHAAKWGGTVTGIDVDMRNIRLCKLLAHEHPDYKIKFLHAKIEDFIPHVRNEEYDLVLCFSVLHWLTLPFGFTFVQKLLEDLAKKVHTGLFEFALKSEFPKNNLPTDYRKFLKGYPFIRVCSYGERHAGFKRPFCFAGNKYVHFDELGVIKIDSFGISKEGDTHFFLCGDKFVKVFYIKHKFLFDMAQREILFLNEFGGQNGLPKLHAAWAEDDETGLRFFLVRDLTAGTPLEEKIRKKEPFDRRNVIEQALKWMVFFEEKGYYFGDCLPKNWIYTDDGRLLPIDYEDMTRDNSFRGWPYDVKLLFVMFMNSVLEFLPEERIFYWKAQRLLSNLKKHVTPKQYEQIATIRDSEKFFSRLYEILFQTNESDTSETACDMQSREIMAIERFLDDISYRVLQNYISCANLKRDVNQIHGSLNKLFGILAEKQKQIERLEKMIQESSNN